MKAAFAILEGPESVKGCAFRNYLIYVENAPVKLAAVVATPEGAVKLAERMGARWCSWGSWHVPGSYDESTHFPVVSPSLLAEFRGEIQMEFAA